MLISYTHIQNKQSKSLIRYLMKIFYAHDTTSGWSEYFFIKPVWSLNLAQNFIHKICITLRPSDFTTVRFRLGTTFPPHNFQHKQKAPHTQVDLYAIRTQMDIGGQAYDLLRSCTDFPSRSHAQLQYYSELAM